MGLRHHWKTAEAGYSLVELALVLTIIGTLGVLATPFFLSYYQASRLRVGAEEVAAFVNLGRQLAIRQNSGACVHIGSATVQYYVGGTVSGGACTCACSAWVGPGTDATGNAKLPQGIGLSANTDFVFSYLGAATPASTITVTNSQTGATVHVTVAASGRVSIGP
jgi:Tfp pilus assembly protein FimT